MTGLEYQQSRPSAFPMGLHILGTDISNAMLEHCQRAEYDGLALSRGLSPERRSKFFDDSGNGMMRLKDAVRKNVSFPAFESVRQLYLAWQVRYYFLS